MSTGLQENRQEANSSSGQLLIRPEVLAARGTQWLGAIRMAQPVSNWLIVMVALLIAGALLTFICVGSVTRKARVVGVTVPQGGNLSVLASNGGVLARTFINEGQRVAAGQPLFEVSTERQGGQGEITALVAQQLEARKLALATERRARLNQDEERRHALEQRLLSIQAEVNQLDQEIVVVQRRQLLAQKSVEKYELLQTNGFMSAAQTQQKQEDVLDLTARLSNLARTKLQMQTNVQALEAERKSLASSLAVDLAQFDRAAASLEQETLENQNRRGSVIVAPEAGTVTTITYQPGQSLLGGQVLATLLPERGKYGDTLEVHLYAPSRTMGFVAVGQQALIRLHAFPYERYGIQAGVVTDVSKTPFAPGELPANVASTILNATTQSGAEGLYRIRVKLQQQTVFAHGKEQALRPGMTLDADIVQERLKIWEWVVAPLMAIARR